MSGTPASAIVGMSGHAGWRLPEVTASAQRAGLERAGAGGGSTMVIITVPPTTACTDSPLDLYGIISIEVPVFC